eukprot:643364-Hanusia_phi.AAC.4
MFWHTEKAIKTSTINSTVTNVLWATLALIGDQDEITPDESSSQAPGAAAAAADHNVVQPPQRLAEEKATQKAKEQQARIAEMKALEEEAHKLLNVPEIGLNEEDITKIADKLHALQNAQTALIERLAQEDRYALAADGTLLLKPRSKESDDAP